MRGWLSLILAAIALFQIIYFGVNIFTIFIALVVAIVAGIIGGSRNNNQRSQRDSDNIAILAQIEKNRYFRKQE